MGSRDMIELIETESLTDKDVLYYFMQCSSRAAQVSVQDSLIEDFMLEFDGERLYRIIASLIEKASSSESRLELLMNYRKAAEENLKKYTEAKKELDELKRETKWKSDIKNLNI